MTIYQGIWLALANTLLLVLAAGAIYEHRLTRGRDPWDIRCAFLFIGMFFASFPVFLF